MNRIGRICIFTLVGLVAMKSSALAHCDAMDGPVVTEARHALESGELAPLLKWVAADDEAVVRDLFDRVRAVRDRDPDVRELADTHFFETAVRLHRAAEGAAYTGLKPAGTPQPPFIAAVDRAIASGSDAEIHRLLAEQIQHGIAHRLEKARALAADAEQGVEDGRRAVHAYVELMHYVKGVYLAAGSSGVAHHDQHSSGTTQVCCQHDAGE